MDCIGRCWQKLFANKIKTIEGIYKIYFLVTFQNPYAEVGIVATRIELVLVVYKTTVLTVELCYNLYEITTLTRGNSPAFTVLDGLQRPVLLCFLPRLKWSARNRTSTYACISREPTLQCPSYVCKDCAGHELLCVK